MDHKSKPNAIIQSQKIIQDKKIQLKKLILESDYDQTYYSVFQNQGKPFQIRRIDKRKLIKHNHEQQLQHEIQILNEIQSQYVSELRAVSQDKDYIYLIQNFIPRGNLFDLMINEQLCQSQIQFYSANILLFLDFLQKNHIVYRDFKLENIMIGNDGYPIISRFQFAKKLHNFERAFTICGTPEYMAPEMLSNAGYKSSVDFWAFGILIYEMNCGFTPFYNEDPMIIYKNILSSQLKFPRDVSKEAKSLCKHLITSHLSKRYGLLKNGINDIKTHKFFQDIHWARLFGKANINQFVTIDLKSDHDTSYYKEINSNYVKGNEPFKDIFQEWF